MQIQLESHHEQQQCDTQLSQQIDLVVCRYPAEYGWPHQDAYRDEGDDQWLPQPYTNGADDGGQHQQHRHFSKDIAKYGSHDSVTHLDSPLRPSSVLIDRGNKERWAYLNSNYVFNRGHLVFQHRRTAEV